MIDPEDLIVPGDPSIHNRLALEAPASFDRATEEIIAARLSQLESRPVVGAYDAAHLQQIHARIFEGVFTWAGKWREPQSSAVTSSLDVLFDRLARENRLKGLDGDAWSKRSTDYFRELSVLEPFIDGNELASLELFRQLASENKMTLRWLNVMSQPYNEEMPLHLQEAERNNLRRILMLAVDPYSSRAQQSRGLEGQNPVELVAPSEFL